MQSLFGISPPWSCYRSAVDKELADGSRTLESSTELSGYLVDRFRLPRSRRAFEEESFERGVGHVRTLLEEVFASPFHQVRRRGQLWKEVNLLDVLPARISEFGRLFHLTSPTFLSPLSFPSCAPSLSQRSPRR